jgi:hypothetical protein
MRLKKATRLATQAVKIFLLAAMTAATRGWGQDSTNAPAASNAPDPLLDLLIQKGILTQQEADRVEAEAQSRRTNSSAQFTPAPPSKWKMDQAIKDVEFFGDARVRYEDRSAEDPEGDQIDLHRWRYSLRFGLRGNLFDDFYYGFRMDTGSNPRSPWVTFGTSTSSSSSYYYGPFGKSEAGLNVGQIYLGWHPQDWIDVMVGKMPNPLFTSTMVWSANINPEGLAERFKYTVGNMDLFANFGQFIYQDMNPEFASGVLQSIDIGQSQEDIYMITWQGGLNYHVTPKLTAKVAGTIYSYYGLKQSTTLPGTTSPYYGDTYVGEGEYGGPGTGYPFSTYGLSGFGTAGNLIGQQSVNYINNQVGLDNLLVLEIPFQVDYKFDGMDAHLFGDFAYNLDGKQRAQAAADAYQNYLDNGLVIGTGVPIKPGISAFPAQTHDVKAYQVGIGIGSDNVDYGPTQGLVYGTSSPRHSWEVRTYWQHIEQYSLDPNLLDLDFFNGLENLQGIYVAASYAFTENVIGTFRYGHASRINNLLGTGGSSGDIPQINPVNDFSIYQADLTVRF